MKIKSLIACVVLLCAILCGCGYLSASANSESTENSRMVLVWSSGELSIYKDKQTEVEYLIFDGYKQGGICPVYNADGTLYTG